MRTPNRPRPAPHVSRWGATLVEVLVALALFTTVFLSAMSFVESEQRASRATLDAVTVEDLALQMLFRLESDLANATGHEPETELTLPVTANETGFLTASTTIGFPPRGTLVLDRGKANEERLAYASLEPTETRFENLQRGIACSQPQVHGDNATVTWSGLARPIADQLNPIPSAFDGITDTALGPVFFRGPGAGFSFRIPIDPAGGSNPLNGDDLFWGADVPDVGQTTDGWLAYYFDPKTVFDEAVARHDLNGDDDMLDVFDVGQIRRFAWDRTDNSRLQDLAMGPSRIVQEQCAWGSDLDADGFDDPMFLWDPDTNELQIRLFVIGTSVDHPVLRRVESTTFLRNEPEL